MDLMFMKLGVELLHLCLPRKFRHPAPPKREKENEKVKENNALAQELCKLHVMFFVKRSYLSM